MANITFIINGGIPDYTVSIEDYIGLPSEWIFPAPGEYTIDADIDECFTLMIEDSEGCIAYAEGCCGTTTTTTTKLSLCENPICESVMTVGYIGPYTGYGDGVHTSNPVGSLSPNCTDVFVIIYSSEGSTVGLSIPDCYSELTLYIDNIPYELFLDSGSEGEYFYVSGETSNPFPSLEQNYNMVICGTLCPPTTTTTTTYVPIPYEYCVKYGYLYNWWAATDARNIAPAGWHLATTTEISTLSTYLGGDSIAGGKLKEVGLTHWNTPNTGASNETAFNGLGSGGRHGTVGSFQNIKRLFECWAPNDDEYSFGRGWSLSYNNASLENWHWSVFAHGKSLRFIKDDPTDTGTMVGNDGKVYPTVKIGNQVWMACNLAETKYRNGNSISGPNFTNEEWIALTTEAYCMYEDTIANAGEDGECPTTTTTTTTTSP